MEKKNIHIFECLLTICLLLMALFSPKKYNFYYSLCAFLLCIIGVVIYFSYWKNKYQNFLDFNPIFISVALIMGFVFPLIIYSQDPETAFYFSWGLPYSLDYINKGACISGMGIVSFMAGTTSRTKILKSMKIKKEIKTNQIIFLFWVIILFTYIILGGFTRYQNIYKGISSQSNPILTYLEVFIVAISQVILINECWNISHFKNYKVNKKSIITIIIVSLVFMYVGNRTICLYLLLPLIIFITTKYLKISLKIFLLFMCIGGIGMIGTMIFRAGYGIDKDLSWYFYLADLMNPNTTTYLSCEIVDKSGFTYGESMLGSILGIIPFGQSILQGMSGLTAATTNSSNIFTQFLGVEVAGTGTNFISDSYLAFGYIGIIIFSYYPGKIIEFLRNNEDKSYYLFLIYMIICGFSVYAVRASFIYILRFIVYGLLFAYLNINLKKWLRHEPNVNINNKQS